MKFFLIAIITILASVSLSQAQDLPTIDEVLDYSKCLKRLTTGCPVTYDEGINCFRCIDLTVMGTITAENMQVARGEAVTLTEYTDGRASVLEFTASPAGRQYAGTDFLMPSYRVDVSNVLISFSGAGSGFIVWEADWCVYNKDEAPCVPDQVITPVKQCLQGGNLGEECVNAVADCGGTSPICSAARNMASGDRVDLRFPVADLDWDQDDRVVIHFSRVYNDIDDTYVATANFEGARFQFRTQTPN